MTVPIDSNFCAAGLHDFVDGELYEVVRTLRGGVADRVTKHDGTGAAADGGGIEALHRFGVGANGIFGDVHRRKIVVDGELHGFFGGALEMIDGPVFHEASNGAGAEKGGGFDGDSDSLRNFGDRANVGFDGAGRGVGANLHAIGGDLAGESFGVLDGAGASAGKANVQRIDAERFHQMQDFDFFFDAGIVDRGILQAVAEGFVVEQDA